MVNRVIAVNFDSEEEGENNMAYNEEITRGGFDKKRKPAKINYREVNPHKGLSNRLLDPKILPKVVRDEMERNRRAREMFIKVAMMSEEDRNRLIDEAEAIIRGDLPPKTEPW
jgi:hypothetical protein